MRAENMQAHGTIESPTLGNPEYTKTLLLGETSTTSTSDTQLLFYSIMYKAEVEYLHRIPSVVPLSPS